MPQPQIADALSWLRDATGMSQAEFGALIGWSQSKVSKLEQRPDSCMRVGDVRKYLGAFGLALIVEFAGADGARGVTVCDRWRESFDAFVADVGARPSKEHTLDRYPDKDGNYEPGNVRWATPKEQARNQRSNHLLTVRGETKCIAEWAEIAGIRPEAIWKRLCRGWTSERAVTTPMLQNGRLTSDEHGAKKLTSENVRTIRAIYKAGGITQVALAKRFGVTNGVICNICQRKTWTSVSD